MTDLHFSFGNAKLPGYIAIFDLPAGWSCPFANKCHSKADKKTGLIQDGPNTEFRCYAASQEALYPNVRNLRWNNFNILKNKSKEEMIKIISNSLPDYSIIRIHSSGDFFNQDYFDAWLYIARKNKDKIFYCYTKSVSFWIKRIKEIPNNFKLNASLGGKLDGLVNKFKLKFVKVVFSQYRAKMDKLKLDKDDSLAYKQDKSFALLLHNTQPAKTEASKAWQRIKETVGGYSK